MLRVVLATVVAALLVCGCGRNDTSQDESHDSPTTAPNEDEPVMPARPVIFSPAPAAPRPSGPLPADASCVTAECHATLANASYIHGPVAQRSCDSCHQSDAGGHTYPLKRSGSETCTFCHSVSGSASVQHKALDQGCMTCHDPHVSRTKFLLKADTIERQCATCHSVPLRPVAHEPFARGDCTLCHQPHQADNRMLLRGGEGSEHCFSCHRDLGATMKTASQVHDPAQRDCATCHSPHATDQAFLLKEPIDQTCLSCHTDVQTRLAGVSVTHGAMTSGEQCANCHSAHASNQPQLLADRQDRVCLSCHNKPVQATDGRTIANMAPVVHDAANLHGPIRSGDCSPCHTAHGGERRDLLTAAFPQEFYARFDVENYQLCFNCHESALVLDERTDNLTNFRDGDANLHYLHVNRSPKGRTCRTCHAIHGSDQHNHMASEVPFEGSDWAMPIAFKKTSTGGSCSPGCHVPRSYDRRGPAVAPITRGEP